MVQGVIQRTSDRQFSGKTFYSFTLSGQDGWYGTGMKRPPEIGKSVRFNEKTNSKGYLEVDGSIEILADAPAAPIRSVGESVQQSAKSGGGGNQGYWDRKEARDITNDAGRELGASRNTAIAFIDLALKHEVFKLPAAAKREEFLWTLMNKYTDKLMGKDGEINTVAETPVNSAVSEDPQSDNWS